MMIKNSWKYLLLMLAMVAFAACSSDDDDSPSSEISLSETDVSVDYDVTFYSINVTSRSVWSAKSNASWLTLIKGNGVGGSEKLTFEMTRNTTKEVRQALITVTCGTAKAEVKVTQGASTIEIMTESDVKDFKKYYKPAEFSSMDMFRSDSKWSWFRHKQSEHFFVFWEPGFGSDPNSSELPEEMRVDIDDLLVKAEQFYKTNITKLKMVETGQGKSVLDSYKMEIYLLYQTEWLATGSGYDNKIGALWVNPSTCKPVGSVIAHEIGHSFQYQVSCDKLLNGTGKETNYGMDCGFRYGFGPNGAGGCSYWEQCAQWQSFQDYPEVCFYDSFYEWKRNAHRHFNHEWMRYASVYFQYYFTEKHGLESYGRIWNESKYPEDPLQTYMRLYCGGDLQKFYDEYAEYAAKVLTYDFSGIHSYAKAAMNDGVMDYSTTMLKEGDKFRPAYSNCPGTTGFNAIALNIPSAGTIVKANLSALAPGSALASDDAGEQRDGDNKIVANVKTYNKQSNNSSDYRFCFVAVKKGEATYGTMVHGANGEAAMTVPAGTDHLYLMVCATPTNYNRHAWNDDESDDEQWPYEVSFTGTNVKGYINIDENNDPTNVSLSYDLKCDASSGEYVLGNLDFSADGTLEKIATAFAMQPAAIAAATVTPSNGTTAQPAEGKIVLGLLQPNGTISYTYTANAGFYVKADGSQGSWSDGDPLWFEYAKDTFIMSYGHYPGKSKAGTKYVVKPVLVYTKGGKQYKATITLNMQF